MNLKLQRPIVFFDIESTGINVAKDRIVEISILKVFPDGKEDLNTFKINPTIKISPEATKIHGISNKDVKNQPTFSDIAREIANILKSCDLCGYNSNKFDIPILAEEFLRTDVDFDFKKAKFVDAQVIFFKQEPRTLTAAYKFYCNKDLKNAHSAEADTIATYEILKAQVERYDNLKEDISSLAKFSKQNNNVDFAGRIIYNSKGIEIFNFGKHKGKIVEEILKKDNNYYNWMMNNDFPLYTKKVLTSIKLRSFNQKF